MQRILVTMISMSAFIFLVGTQLAYSSDPIFSNPSSVSCMSQKDSSCNETETHAIAPATVGPATKAAETQLSKSSESIELMQILPTDGKIPEIRISDTPTKKPTLLSSEKLKDAHSSFHKVNCMKTLPFLNFSSQVTPTVLKDVRETLMRAKADLQQDAQARKDLVSVEAIFRPVMQTPQLTSYSLVQMLQKVTYAAKTKTGQNLVCYILVPAATRLHFSDAHAAAFYFELGNFYEKAGHPRLAEESYLASLSYYENSDYYEAYINQLISNSKYEEAKKVVEMYINWLKVRRPLRVVKTAKKFYQKLAEHVDVSELPVVGSVNL